MDLRRYLFEHRITATDFAESIGCSRIHLSEVINARRKPSLLLATSIQNFTKGEVSVEEMLAIEKVKPKRKLKPNPKKRK